MPCSKARTADPLEGMLHCHHFRLTINCQLPSLGAGASAFNAQHITITGQSCRSRLTRGKGAQSYCYTYVSANDEPSVVAAHWLCAYSVTGFPGRTTSAFLTLVQAPSELATTLRNLSCHRHQSAPRPRWVQSHLRLEILHQAARIPW